MGSGEEESLTLIKPFLYSLPRKQQRWPKKEAQGRREERFVCVSRSRAIDRVRDKQALWTVRKKKKKEEEEQEEEGKERN